MDFDAFFQSLELGFLVLVFVGPIVLLLLAWWIGAQIEKSHYASIRQREARWAHLPAVPTRTIEDGRTVAEARLVLGGVVIANNHFKKFVAGLRQFFGGRVQAYESLLDRARREAILRMKESCPEAHAILNLRLETSTISQDEPGKGISGVEVLAHGTAIRYQ